MPSSDAEHRLGTIFMGPTPDRETTLDKLYAVAQRDVWNKRTEDEYMERIKARATERVRALLLQARQRGDEILTQAESRAGALQAEAEAVRNEAEQIRQAAEQELEKARAISENAEHIRAMAHQEGHAAGRAEATALLDEERHALGETTAVVLISIQEQCSRIFEAWRDDMAALLREAVEKGSGWLVDKARADVLNALLEQSMRTLLDTRRFIVRVNPADAALVTGILEEAHKSPSRAASWELATDPELEPGSLVVESDSALVDNSRKARRSVVDEILEHLSLPQGQADQAAFDAVTNTLVDGMRKHGVDLQDNGTDPGGIPGDHMPNQPEADPAQSSPEITMGASDTAVAGNEAHADFAQDSAPLHSSAQEAPTGQDNAFSAEPSVAPANSAADPNVSAESSPEISHTEFPPEGEPFATPEAPQEVAQEFPQEPPLTPQAGEAEAEARDMVQEFLSTPPSVDDGMDDNTLPADIADDLLAEMGFSPAQNQANDTMPSAPDTTMGRA